MVATLLSKLLSTQELRVLCTARCAIGVAGEQPMKTEPLKVQDAARLFRILAGDLQNLPPELKKEANLVKHPVLTLLRGLPQAIWQTI